jgi:hypothetical protein
MMIAVRDAERGIIEKYLAHIVVPGDDGHVCETRDWPPLAKDSENEWQQAHDPGGQQALEPT